MEVLFVSHKYPPATGGMEKQSYELINGMRSCAKVHHIVHTGEESYFQFFRKLNSRILKAIHSHPKIALIHFNDGLIAAFSLWHSGYGHVKRVVTVHGLDVVFPLALYQQFVLPQFNRFDHIIAVSGATAQAIINRGVEKHKVSVVLNGIDHQLSSAPCAKQWDVFQRTYALPPYKKILVMLGRPVRRKGFSWFIREVLPQLPEDVLLLMAGPFQHQPTKIEKWLRWLPKHWQHLIMLFLGFPSDQADIRHVLHEGNHTQRIRHLGKLPLDDLRILLTHAHAFLMPNIKIRGDMEGFGLVCLEASMCGTLVLAADIEGITDAILDNKNGIHVQHGNAAAWTTTIEQVLSAQEDYTNKKLAYRAFTISHFGWNKMVKGYAQLFQTIIDG
ncbi:glycosyltransferase family 4 protein [Sphingobacterium paludis]|uniref:Phosphatidylinositol alpha-1,6-mannosyltransferase n=1 Tax=Sphingobacterium paludis TaxID=1476465 RepID=A0A4R7DB26_9SPHI|nr:glycosyltransferase family 4 protein [Sphingobacterium paludis]TDS17471.1 phosphatidylinositol alpha-1,6-mannosyltransferase [Sphingobacterium paludis]